MNDTEKLAAVEEYEKNYQKRYKTGKTIVSVIVIINLLATAVSAIIDFNLFTVIFNVAISIALFLGVSWIRYLCSVFCVLDSFLYLYLITNLSSYPQDTLTVSLIVWFAALIIYKIAVAVLIAFNKNVADFLYAQKNG